MVRTKKGGVVMASSFLLQFSEGPGRSDLLDGLSKGDPIYFMVRPGLGTISQKIFLVINECTHVLNRRKWLLSGNLRVKGIEVEFKGLSYDSTERKGNVEIFSDRLELHPICAHVVPWGNDTCQVCGMTRRGVE